MADTEVASPKERRKDSAKTILVGEGKRGSGGSNLECESPSTPNRTNKKFIENWRHACGRTKNMIKKLRPVTEPSTEEDPIMTAGPTEDTTVVAATGGTGWSEHVWSKFNFLYEFQMYTAP